MTPVEIFEAYEEQAERFLKMVSEAAAEPSVAWGILTALSRKDAIAFADELMLCPDEVQTQAWIRRDIKRALSFNNLTGLIREMEKLADSVAAALCDEFSANQHGGLTPFCILGFITKYLVEHRIIFASD